MTFLNTTPLALLINLFVLMGAAAAAPAAFVTDIQGQASITAPKQQTLNITDVVDLGARIIVSDRGRLTILYAASGDEYVFQGPAAFTIDPAQPRVVSGRPPQRKTLLRASEAVRIANGTASQAGLVMRSASTVRLTSPGATVLDRDSVRFEWTAGSPATEYKFVLTDAGGSVLYEAAVTESSLALPRHILLHAGATHLWEVTARTPNGSHTSTSGAFIVADDELVRRVAELRPPPHSSVSERAAYAMWLDHQGLAELARTYWHNILLERPNDEAVKRLTAAELKRH